MVLEMFFSLFVLSDWFFEPFSLGKWQIWGYYMFWSQVFLLSIFQVVVVLVVFNFALVFSFYLLFIALVILLLFPVSCFSSYF